LIPVKIFKPGTQLLIENSENGENETTQHCVLRNGERLYIMEGIPVSIALISSLVWAVSASAQSGAKRPSEIPLTAEAAAAVALDRSPALKAARARARAEEALARADGKPENPKLVADYKAGSGAGRTELALTFDLWSLIGAGARARPARSASAPRRRWSARSGARCRR
jgi:hypothetical protein